MNHLLRFLLLVVVTSWATPATFVARNGASKVFDFVALRNDTLWFHTDTTASAKLVGWPKSLFQSVVLADGTPIPLDNNDAVHMTDSQSSSAKPDTNVKESAAITHRAGILVLPFDTGASSVQTDAMRQLTAALLQDSLHTPTTLASAADIPMQCADLACTFQALAAMGWDSLLVGQVRKRSKGNSWELRMKLLAAPSGAALGSAELRSKEPLELVNGASLAEAVSVLLGRTSAKPRSSWAKVFVETEPEGALLSLGGREDLCRTPCETQVPADTRVEIWATWNVEGMLWAGTKSLQLSDGDSSRIFIRLEKTLPGLHVSTQPMGAEIHPGPLVKPTLTTPKTTPSTIQPVAPGLASFTLFLPGYHDTTVQVLVPPHGVTNVDIELRHENDASRLIAQDSFLKLRSKQRLGIGLIAASIGPLVAGGILWYLAEKDYDDARSIADRLSTPSADGPHRDALVDRNHDLRESGDSKVRMAIGSGITSAALFTAGILLRF